MWCATTPKASPENTWTSLSCARTSGTASSLPDLRRPSAKTGNPQPSTMESKPKHADFLHRDLRVPDERARLRKGDRHLVVGRIHTSSQAGPGRPGAL